MTDYELLSGRELGKLPLSLGTAIPFEALQLNPIGKIGTIAINLHTLFRNVFSALPREQAQVISVLAYVDTMLQEMTVIEQVVTEIDRNTKIVYYLPDYSNLPSKYPHARVRTANTDNQKVYAGLCSDCLESLTDTLGFSNHHVLVKKQVSPSDFTGKAVVFTNYAVDLLHIPYDGALLESHTGLLKYRSEWNTKLHSNIPVDRIPFNVLTLQVFGDSTNFSPMAMKVKNFVLEVANDKKWTPATTADRIVFSLKGHKDQFSALSLLAMMK